MESAAPERQPDQHAGDPAADLGRTPEPLGARGATDGALADAPERINAAAASFVNQAASASDEQAKVGRHVRTGQEAPAAQSTPAPAAHVEPAASAAQQQAENAPVDFWRYRVQASQQAPGQGAPRAAAQPAAQHPSGHASPAAAQPAQAQPSAQPQSGHVAAGSSYAQTPAGAGAPAAGQVPDGAAAAGPRVSYYGSQPSAAPYPAQQGASGYAQQSAAATRDAAVRYAEQTLAYQGDASLRAQQMATMQGTHAAVEVAPRKSSALAGILSFVIMLAIVVGAAWLMRMFVVSPYEIPSGSMEQTILSGDKVFSEKLSYYMHGIQPGDIVTFDDPEVNGRTLIKRCIAVAGQTVELHDGIVYVDGAPLDEPYTNGKPSEALTPAPGMTVDYPYTVPEGHIWVMGDNRTNSADSRYFGAVPTSSVTGHAFCIYWPFDRMSLLN